MKTHKNKESIKFKIGDLVSDTIYEGGIDYLYEITGFRTCEELHEDWGGTRRKPCKGCLSKGIGATFTQLELEYSSDAGECDEELVSFRTRRLPDEDYDGETLCLGRKNSLFLMYKKEKGMYIRTNETKAKRRRRRW